MPDLVADLLCGFAGGALGGYLGLGGGIILVPALTLLAGVPITAAVPVSLSAIVVNSIAASNEYLKKGMVDFELVVILSFFMVSGNIFGSTLNTLIPSQVIRIIFAVVMVYSAFSFLRGRQPTARLRFQDKRATHLFAASALTLGAGMLAGLLGIGGGVIIVPLLYLFLGVPLTTARGTSSFTIGFSSAAALAVYFLVGRLDVGMATGVVIGSVIGAKVGGFLGTLAKPVVVKILFFIVMIYLSFKFAWEPLKGLF